MNTNECRIPRIITRSHLKEGINWQKFVDALADGHRCPRAQVEDSFLGSTTSTLLSRAAWIEGLGFGVKSVTFSADNASIGRPTVQGAMLLFDSTYGELKAVIDGPLITDIKTASDSVLGAKLLARKDSKSFLVIGAGSVASNIVSAYHDCFPGLESMHVWVRDVKNAQYFSSRMAEKGIDVTVLDDLEGSIGKMDIITTATSSVSPVLMGKWVSPGTHVDLIGAFRKDMREADDELMQKARLFVDNRETTIHHIGELMIPLSTGVISESDVLADLYELANGQSGRNNDDEITLFKNGGGAHLDLMVALAILGEIR